VPTVGALPPTAEEGEGKGDSNPYHRENHREKREASRTPVGRGVGGGIVGTLSEFHCARPTRLDRWQCDDFSRGLEIGLVDLHSHAADGV
jgi:hypothetical protein